MVIMDNNNLNQGQSGQTKSTTKKRRWDGIVVGIVFSIAFALLIMKVAQTTPCEVLNYFNIDTRACTIAGDDHSAIGRFSSQHGLGFSIVSQFAILVLDLSEEVVSHYHQFLQNIGLQ
jgi:hypothetical protein